MAYKDINLQFDSLAAFSRHIAAGTTQPAFLERYLSNENLPSQDMREKRVKFSGTKSFEEADQLMREGDIKSMDLLKNMASSQKPKITTLASVVRLHPPLSVLRLLFQMLLQECPLPCKR